jgi:hypothetical protein
MSEVHTYKTRLIGARELNGTHVLVGECGGLSAVFAEPQVCLGVLVVETEHGEMVFGVDRRVEVLEEEQ